MIVPSSSFSAMLPVKPSVTTTSAAPRSRSRLSALPGEVEAALAQERVRVERQLVALLVLFADREEAHLGVLDAEQLPAEDRAHVGELEQVLGARVGVRAGVEQHGGAVAGGDRHRDRGPHHAGEAPQVDQAGGEHGAGVAGGDDRVGRPARRPRGRPRRGSSRASPAPRRPACRPSRSSRSCGARRAAEPLACRGRPPGRRASPRAVARRRVERARGSPRRARCRTLPPRARRLQPTRTRRRAYGAWRRSGSTSRPL